MINDYHSDGWTDLLEGILWKMAEKICENRQRYKTVDGVEVVHKDKQVLKEHFHSAAAMQVVELEAKQKYMVMETYRAKLNSNLNQPQPESPTQVQQQRKDMPPLPGPARVKTNVLHIQEKTCSCGRWQEYKYPCRHAIAYIRKWEDMSFPDILKQHMHDYYRNKSMQQIYEHTIFPVVQDQIRYDGQTHPPTLGA